MSQRLLSIILPVYNLEKYLQNTLVNLTQEQFSPKDSDLWEILIVDDGSTDKSSEIIAEYAKYNYPGNIRVITTENRGVSHARNIALEQACGKYIFFADGDDLICRRSLITLCHIMEQNDSSILHFGYNELSLTEYLSNIGNTPTVSIDSPQKVNTREFCDQTIGLTQPTSQWAVWQNLFRQEFLKKNNISFQENLAIGEDAIFIWTALQHSTEILLITSRIYNYTVRNDSVFHKPLTDASIRSRLDYIRVMTDQCNKLQSSGFGSPTIFGIRCNLRTTARQIITEGLIRRNASYGHIFRVLKFLKEHDICGIGLTRRANASAPFSIRLYIKSKIISYILTPIIKYFF